VEGKSHTLAQLIVSVKRIAEEVSLHGIHREEIAEANGLVVVWISRIRSRALLA